MGVGRQLLGDIRPVPVTAIRPLNTDRRVSKHTTNSMVNPRCFVLERAPSSDRARCVPVQVVAQCWTVLPLGGA